MTASQARWLVGSLVLVLAVIAGTQSVMHWTQVDFVRKTMAAQLMVYQNHGAESYQRRVVSELRARGLDVAAEDIEIVEDTRTDVARMRLAFEWPLRVLFVTRPREHVAEVSTPLYRY